MPRQDNFSATIDVAIVDSPPPSRMRPTMSSSSTSARRVVSHSKDLAAQATSQSTFLPARTVLASAASTSPPRDDGHITTRDTQAITTGSNSGPPRCRNRQSS